MNRKFSAVLLLILLFTAITASADSIVVINKTGYDLYYLQVSPSDSDEWGEDVLGDDVLLDGGNIKLDIDGYDVCELDIMAVDEEDDAYIIWSFDSCSGSKVVFTMDDLYIDDPEGGVQDFTIQNDTGFDIYYIYVSPDYADDWEEDVLGEGEILSAGDSYFISFTGYGDYCSFDVRLVDEDGDTYTKWGVDLCSTYTLSISLDDLDY